MNSIFYSPTNSTGTMAEIQDKATIQSQRFITDDIVLLTINSPRIASVAQPGQFVMVKCSDSNDPLLRRPFSIHNCTQDGQIQILFKIIGRGTRLLSALNTSERVDLLGPLGVGFNYQLPGPVCYLGGGMGIAPLYLLAKRRVQLKHKKDLVLLGASNEGELSCQVRLFQDLGLDVLHATDDGSMGHHGFVTDLLPEIHSTIRQFFVCGPHPMMTIVARFCLSACIPCQVSLETHMACGLGACLGCTVHAKDGTYRHVCKHGPVFNAGEVLWTHHNP